MGYDCYVEPRKPSPTAALTSEATPEQWRAAIDAASAQFRDDEDAHHYFRRNLSGGSRLADALIATGMGFGTEQWGSPPPFPKPEEYGVEMDSWDGEPIGARADEYRRDVRAVLAWHGPEIPGIPAHKVCSTNDGWLITQPECRAAVALYEKHIAEGGEHPEAFGDDFLPFLREAARHDGFSVH